MDASQPGATPLAIGGPIELNFSMGARGHAVAYSGTTGFYLDDFIGTSTPTTTVSGGFGTQLAWTWSRDGRYIAVSALRAEYVPDHYDLLILRTDGANASSAVRLSNISEQRVTYAWQP